MKRKICLFILVFVTALLQTTLCPIFSIAQVRPNLLVILTASFGLMCGRRSGMLTGFFTGLFIDLMGGGVLGFYALIGTWIGYLSGLTYRIFYDDDIKTPLVLIGASDLIFGLYAYVGTFLVRGRIHFLFYLTRIIIPEMIYTVIIAFFAYRINFWINRKLTGGWTGGI